MLFLRLRVNTLFRFGVDGECIQSATVDRTDVPLGNLNPTVYSLDGPGQAHDEAGYSWGLLQTYM